MAVELKCRDLGIACDVVIRAENAEELVRKFAAHMLSVHGIDIEVTGMLGDIRAVIYVSRAP
jgi:predicted small metal-binding protein